MRHLWLHGIVAVNAHVSTDGSCQCTHVQATELTKPICVGWHNVQFSLVAGTGNNLAETMHDHVYWTLDYYLIISSQCEPKIPPPVSCIYIFSKWLRILNKNVKHLLHVHKLLNFIWLSASLTKLCPIKACMAIQWIFTQHPTQQIHTFITSFDHCL